MVDAALALAARGEGRRYPPHRRIPPVTTLAEGLVTYFDYLVLARARLLDGVRQVPSSYTQPFSVGLGSIRATLLHVAGAEWGYVEALAKGEVSAQEIRQNNPFTVERLPELESLIAALGSAAAYHQEGARRSWGAEPSDRLARARSGPAYAVPTDGGRARRTDPLPRDPPSRADHGDAAAGRRRRAESRLHDVDGAAGPSCGAALTRSEIRARTVTRSLLPSSRASRSA